MTTVLEIIGHPRFLFQTSVDAGVTGEEFKIVREYACQKWEQFLEVLEMIKIASEKSSGKYNGYEIAGHGIAFYGDSFSLKDYSYVENIITPALRKYISDQPKGWHEFWAGITSQNLDAMNPAYLKRAAVPILVEQLISNTNSKDILNILKGYMKVNAGIPHLTDIIFENVLIKSNAIADHYKLELLRGDIDSFNEVGDKYWEWYFRSIFAYEILFSLLTTKNPDINGQAGSLLYTWLSKFENELFNILVSSHFDYALIKLLDSWEGKRALIDIINTLVDNHAEKINKFDRALDPTSNIAYILSICLYQDEDTANTLLEELLRQTKSYASMEYTIKILILALEELASHEQHKDLVDKVMTKYKIYLHEDQLTTVRTELSDKYSHSEKPTERRKAFEICKNYLEKGLSDPQSLAKEYAGSDRSMEQEQGSSIQISGIEGKCLLIIHRLAKDYPLEVYSLALSYWTNSESAYLVDMASIPLRQSIIELIYTTHQGKIIYNYERAREIFVEWGGNDLEKLQRKPYTFVGVWRGISNIIAILRPVLTFEEVQKVLQMGEGKEHSHWILPYYVKFHDDVPSQYQWNSEDKIAITEQFHNFLIKPGKEDEIAQLLTDIRNNILKDRSSSEDLEMIKELIESREQRHYRLIDVTGHVLLDAAKKNDKKFLEIVELYYKKWLIPFVVEMPQNIGFVYIPRTKEVIEWFVVNEPEKGVVLKKELTQMPEEWQMRIFEDTNFLKSNP